MSLEKKYVHEAYGAIFQQDFKKAIDCFLKAISCNPGNHSLYYKLSITYGRSNQLDLAIKAIEEAIKVSKHKSNTYGIQLQNLQIRKLAREATLALDHHEKLEPYIEEIQKHLLLDPHHLELQWILGLIYYSMGEIKKADQHMQKILTINPLHKKALQYFQNRSEHNVH